MFVENYYVVKEWEKEKKNKLILLSTDTQTNTQNIIVDSVGQYQNQTLIEHQTNK